MRKKILNFKRYMPFLIILIWFLQGCDTNIVQNSVAKPVIIDETGVSPINDGSNLAFAKQDNPGFRLVESNGTEIVQDKIPERVVVISFGTATIFDALGIKPVGIVSTRRKLPEGLREVEKIGIPSRPDLERIISLRAQLVITSSSFKDAQSQLFEQNNLPVYFIDNQRYEDTIRSIEILGRAFDKEEQAKSLVSRIREREAMVLKSIENKKSPSVLVLYGTSESFKMATGNSYIGSLLEILNAVNIADKSILKIKAQNYIPLSLEKVVEENPEVILRISHGDGEKIKGAFDKEFEVNSLWKSVDAVKNRKIYDLDEELFYANPGLGAIDALEKLSDILYPEMEE